MGTTTKITAEQLKRAAALGIKAKDADGVKKELIKELAKQDVEGVEGESMDELLEMYEAFFEAETEETEEDEVNQLAEEADDEEEEEEEEEVVAKPKAKVVAKPVAAPVKAAASVAKKPAPAKKEATEKLSAWSSEEKGSKKALQPIIDLFPDAEIKWLKQGLTVFFLGKSSKKAIISFDRVKVAADGTVVGDLFFNALKGKDEVHQHVGEDKPFKNFNANLLFLSKLPIDEAVEILEEGDLIAHMNKTLASADKRAVVNREKLEEKISGTKEVAKPAKTVTKAKAVVEEEEEEEVPVVKKKVVAAAPVKAVKKPVVVEEEEQEEEEAPVAKKPLLKKK